MRGAAGGRLPSSSFSGRFALHSLSTSDILHSMIDLITYTCIAAFYIFNLGVWSLAAYELFYRITR